MNLHNDTRYHPNHSFSKMYRPSSQRILPRGHDRNMTTAATTAAFMSSLPQQRRNVIQRPRSNSDGCCRRRCRRYHSSHVSATNNTAEYQNFSHHALTIASAPPSALPRPQQQQHDDDDPTNNNNQSLVFGQTFTPHMLQIHYQNGQWSAPQIVPYQNLSVSPAASSLQASRLSACIAPSSTRPSSTHCCVRDRSHFSNSRAGRLMASYRPTTASAC